VGGGFFGGGGVGGGGGGFPHPQYATANYISVTTVTARQLTLYKQRKPQFQNVWLTAVLAAQQFQLIASNSAELSTASAVSPKRQWVCRLCSQIIKATRDVVSTFPFILFELPFSFQTITHYFPQPLLPMTKVREPNPETGCSHNPNQ